jgi:hypothetical protein
MNAELDQRIREAQELRGELERNGLPVDDLNRTLDAFRQLRNANFGNLQQVANLQQGLMDAVRQMEFAVRRQVEGEKADKVFLSGSDAVPQAYRSMVEEYYRQLSKPKPAATAPATTPATPPPPQR